LRGLIAIAAAAFLGFVPLGSLTAQPVTHYPDANWDLSPDGVLAIMRAKGLEPLSRPQRQGTAYAVRALDPTNREVQVTVDARSGRILGVTATAAAANPVLSSIPPAADEQAHNSRISPRRSNVAPAAKLSADTAKPGADVVHRRLDVADQRADALSASAAVPVQAAPGLEFEE
jgi:hypothetical protein